MTTLCILLIDDDPESLRLLEEALPKQITGFDIKWETCGDFDEALELLGEFRYDIVVSDIYVDVPDQIVSGGERQSRAADIIDTVRNVRFSPIVLFTSGSHPEFIERPLIEVADKSVGHSDIESKLSSLIATGIPGIAQELHNELDRYGGSYLWKYLGENQNYLENSGLDNSEVIKVLDRLLRRRSAIQLGRLEPGSHGEIDFIEGAEFYLHPSLVEDEFRLGEILCNNDNNDYCVVLTPHCHLVVQSDAHGSKPKADFVLTVKTIAASELFIRYPITSNKKLDELRRRLQSPADFGRPAGRYWFLPGFLEVPHLYADFMQLESIEYEELKQNYRSIAVLDVPFAEAFQSCFVRFYSAVGLPNLIPDRFHDLLPDSTEQG